ncbi:N-acetylglucosamine-1-phosphotransferase subunit gamma-like isoform X2 [Hydractinia symbiolongicarpus]|uniref:N-acetylglucosamine-1-phosphotransferase subunit gamma-like isoform X2 n=1 Tax=Hydractinia symbiolongicarpus TaxID=13093 RepID=UPI00255195DE|nr:N-acetylglucosamine-1-phosphotransferase subunit gamma-like isoform X2 [Hydractinia symbiolongicarpus]
MMFVLKWILLFYMLLPMVSEADTGKIKMVEAPFSFNNAASGTRHGDSGEIPLIARISAQKPSGPQFLISNLHGKCFTQLLNTYKYEFCPYHNVTQREQTYRWNAFHGVLGIWKEWKIMNGTFSTMHMVKGEVCSGVLDREIQVTLRCGKRNEIVSVEEPTMCRYNMLFKTPYACPQDVLLVYPMLSHEGKKRWREIEESYVMNEITEKGYQKRRKKVFIDEGLNVNDNPKRKNRFRKENPIISKSEAKYSGSSKSGILSYHDLMYQFATKSQCVEEYRKLLAEVELIRAKIANCTTIQHTDVQLDSNQNLTGWS